MVAVAQLREKILSLDKQLKAKNQELLKKDVKVGGSGHMSYNAKCINVLAFQITELKSEINKEQRECREKIQGMQKSYNERIQELQQKITTLSKQLATLTKASKKGGKDSDGSPLNF